MATRSRYGVVEGDTYFYFTASDEVYTSLASDLGWTKDSTTGTPEKMHSSSSKRARIALTLAPASSTSGGLRPGSARVYCAIEKLEEALKGLPGKTYNGRAITGARIPRKISYS